MMVADREADIFDLFARRPAHVDGPMSMYWCGQRMTAPWQMAADWPGRLAGQISGCPCLGLCGLGTAVLTIPAGPGRAARAATLAIQFGEFCLNPPRDRRESSLTPVVMQCVDLLETAPPEGVKPVHWRRLTTRRITSVIAALALAELYARRRKPSGGSQVTEARRWKIEDVFRTMKSKGFDIEHLNIADTAPRNRHQKPPDPRLPDPCLPDRGNRGDADDHRPRWHRLAPAHRCL